MADKLGRFFSSFRFKMYILIFSVALIPFIMFSWYSAGTTRSLLMQSMNEQLDRNLKSLATETDELLTIMENSVEKLKKYSGLSRYPYENRKLTNYEVSRIQLFYQDEFKSFKDKIQIRFDKNPVISSYLFSENQNVLIDTSFTFFTKVNGENIDFVRQYEKEREEKGIWLQTTELNFYAIYGVESPRKLQRYFTYILPVINSDNKITEIMAINLDGTIFSDMLEEIGGMTAGAIVILDASNKIIWSDLPELYDNYEQLREIVKKTDMTMNYNGEEVLVSSTKCQQRGWKYYYILPTSSFLEPVTQMKSTFLRISLPLILVLLFLTRQLTDYLYMPIKKLLIAMQGIKNRDLSTRIEEKRKDEYGQVYSCFNEMTSELNALIDNIAMERTLKQQLQIRLLQSQMNPHFIYNTLETIYSIALINKDTEAAKLVEVLSSFYRISLSEGYEDITLRESVNMVREYLYIQAVRFRGKIAYEIDIPSELYNTKVPKFMLQSLVENAVYHGLEKKAGQGKLDIICYIEGNVVKVVVRDNGVGMAEKELKLLQLSLVKPIETIYPETKKHGYALRNLSQQLRMKYGEDYGLKINSVYQQGTEVVVCLPC